MDHSHHLLQSLLIPNGINRSRKCYFRLMISKLLSKSHCNYIQTSLRLDPFVGFVWRCNFLLPVFIFFPQIEHWKIKFFKAKPSMEVPFVKSRPIKCRILNKGYSQVVGSNFTHRAEIHTSFPFASQVQYLSGQTETTRLISRKGVVRTQRLASKSIFKAVGFKLFPY